jgi:hypothetical protein
VVTNAIPDHPGKSLGSATIGIVRFNKSELAVHVQVAYEGSFTTNFLRRYKRSGTFTETVMQAGELVEPQSNLLLDKRGYFSTQLSTNSNDYIIRRYSN